MTTSGVGTTFVIESDATDQRTPRVAWNGAVFTVVFEDDRSLATTGTDVYARPVKPTGTVLPAYVVASSAVHDLAPAIAQRSGLLSEVSYVRRAGTGFDSGVWGQSLNADAVAGAPFVISDGLGTRETFTSLACGSAVSCVDAYQWFRSNEFTYGTDRIVARVLSY